MSARTKKTAQAIGGGIGLLVLRAALPVLLTWLANRSLRKVPGYRGRILRIRLDFTAPRVMVQGFSLAALNGGGAEHHLQVASIVAGSHWRDILAGKWIGYIRMDAPWVLLNLEGQHRNGNGNNAKPAQEVKAVEQSSWQERVKQLPAFRLSSAVLADGEVHVRGIPGQAGTDLRIDRVNLSLVNITNNLKVAPTLMATAAGTARVMVDGELALRAEGYPLAEPPAFDFDFQTSKVDLTNFRSLIEHYAGVAVRRGVADLYVEAAAKEGYIEGYAKPIFDHLELAPPPARSGWRAKLKAWSAQAAVKLGKNKHNDRIATRLDFAGSLADPSLNITAAILKFIRNGFGVAERASLERRFWFSRAGKTPDQLEVHFGSQPSSKAAATLRLFKETFSRWSADAAPRMAAALAYYTAFSMAPLLILAIAIAGLMLGHDAAQGKIVAQISDLVGQQSAIALQGMIQARQHPAKGIFASVIGIVALLAGATGVLSELKSALNTIWRTQEHSDVKEIVKKNVLFLGMLLGIGFLLTVSLVASAAVAGVGKFLGGFLPAPELLLQAVNFVLSISVITVLFAAMYRFLPNTRVDWHDVWVGAIVTAFLFELGKLGLGLYLGKSTISSSYGAAGSILVLLLWVYYSGLIFYFGAEFTRVFADQHGSRKTAKPGTMRRARQAVR
jgi:membrane protein